MASGDGGESWRQDKYFANNRRDKNIDESNPEGRRLSTYSRKPVRERYTYNYDENGEWIGDGKEAAAKLDLKTRAATLQFNLPEDMRISKLLRRLCGENDPAQAIDLCEKLKMGLHDKSNAAYINRSFDILADSIISVIENGPSECLFHAAEVFGLMGYVVRNDFPKYKTWIVKMYKKSKNLKVYMMKALCDTLRYDSNSLDLRDQSTRLMELLKDFLEAVDHSDIFLAIIDVIVVICHNYPKNFEPFFTDIVDIVVGWHLEAEQSGETKFHISRALQEFNPFWEKDLKFTLNLLTLFLEDIAGCGDEIAHKNDEESEDATRNVSPYLLDKSVLPEFCFGSFVGAFNTVLKCLFSSASSPETLVSLVGKQLLEDSFTKIVIVATQAIEQNHSEEIVMPVNEYICLLVDCVKADVQISIDEYFGLMRIELKNNQKYSTKQILSLLMVVLKTVCQYKGNLPLEFVEMLFNPSSEFLKIRFWKNERVHRGLIKIYHEILNIKNVSLLQETYKHILRDIEKALRSLIGMEEIADALSQQQEDAQSDTSNVKYTELQAEIVLNFNFSALSALATTNNSIMAMWALQPSLLELLAHKLRLADTPRWHQRYQVLHYAFLKLLSAHCMINNNFITSSVLLNTKNSKMAEVFNKLSMLSSSQSPTSEHFGLILVFLCEILKNDKELVSTSSATATILLDWCNDLFGHITQYAEILKTKPEFTAIVKRISAISNNAADPSFVKTSLKCAACLQKLLSNFETLHSDCYTSIAEICCVQMCSVNYELREKYSYLFSMLPLKYSLKQVNEYTGQNEMRAAQTGQLQSWHLSSDMGVTLRPQYFKTFIERIQFSRDAEHIEEFLKEIFPKCWHVDYMEPKSIEFMDMTRRDIRCMVSWIQNETAQFCVNNKLRTPIGKPQDTFLKIESILKEDARILAMKEKSSVKNIDTLLANYKQSRTLLGLLEALEKAIYNASDGTAFAMQPAENPAKTFFRINTSTCKEWFNRIRGAVDLVALHGMESEMVIRYSQHVLKEMADTGRTNDPVFENTLRSLCWALLRNGESDSLYGLYVWIKNVTNNNRKYSWLKITAEQAAGHRELAALGYLIILDSAEKEESSIKLDSYTREFIVDMAMESLLFTSQISELRKLLLKEESRTIPRVSVPLMTLTSSQMDCIIKYEETKDHNVVDLANWEILDKDNISSNFSCHRLISLVENTLGNILLGQDPFPVDTSRYIFRIIHSLLQESLRTRSHEYLNQLTIVNHICHKAILCKLKDRSAGNSDIKSFLVDKSYGSFTLLRILFWSEYFDGYTNEGEQQITDIRLDIVSMARKETNYQMCQRELEKFYQVGDYANRLKLDGLLSVDSVRDRLLTNATDDVEIWDVNLSRAVYEQCKWMYATSFNDPQDLPRYLKEEAIQLAAAATIGICQRITITTSDGPQFIHLKEKAARYLLKLSEWLQTENENLITGDVNSPLTRLVTVLPDVRPEYAAPTISSFIPTRDAAVGKLIQYSCKQYPELAKVWGAFGAWCYRWGRKMVELKVDSGAASVKNADIVEIRKILTSATDVDVDRIVEILNQHKVAIDDEEVICDNNSSTELIESQLRATVPCLATESDCNLEAIVKIWKQSRRNIYIYYEMAADAYFRYLKLATNSTTNKNTPIEEADGDEQHDSSVITATLRILRLIVKHALGLQDVLEEGLASTPTSPWKIIIPQLFSRLNHPEPYVRRRVSELLCRVAADSPHLIIFPTVVGAVAQEKQLDISATVGNLDLDQNNPQVDSSGLTCGFQSLLDTLSQQSPETVQQVKVLVHELKRIALLWDDLWLVSLTQIYIECSKKFKLFFEGAANTTTTTEDHTQKPKVDVASEKYRIVMLPVIFVMEKLHDVTSRKAETNYEKGFQDKYSGFIEETIKEMKSPANEKLTEGWQRFKTLFGRLKQQAQRRPQYTLKMSDISPVLAQLKNTSISMPGVDNKIGSGDVFIKSIDNLVQILPTKTKPKKLIFHGSDGRQYTFLFKGLEDLHLDERIMQFLSISNLMMTKSVGCNGSVSFYRAVHYSVIPLGPRSGLISWVDNVTPIFNLYKKWQQREASNPKRDKNFAVLRTSEIFYNKLTPLLAEHNLKITDNRKEWPMAVLRRVLKELTEETPRDLLAKELWCHSTTAAVWRKAVRNYSLSLAVMSVIGYIIGLGDRHLSNILVNLSTGEIVHIDYNVCFEKGKTFAVPEKVPFRMTPNLEAALGVTGIEGTFRLACEHVLKSLKKGRETLLTLLEAFVYDPLVDWAVGEDGLVVTAYAGVEAICIGELRQAKKQLEREVNRDTLAVRFTEIKPDWMQNRDDLYHQLLQMQSNLQKLESQRRAIQLAENQRDMLSKQLILIQQANALGSAICSHPLNTLSQRYNTVRMARNEYEFMKKLLVDKSMEAKKFTDDYFVCMRDINNDKLIEYIGDLQDNNVQENNALLSEYELVKEFLENSAQQQTYRMGDETRRELHNSAAQQVAVVRTAYELLIQYGGIACYFSNDYQITGHRLNQLQQVFKHMIETQIGKSGQEMMARFAKGRYSQQSIEQFVVFACHMKKTLDELQYGLQENFGKLKAELEQPQQLPPKPPVLMYEGAKSIIEAFAANEVGAQAILEVVSLSFLTDLNQKYLEAEKLIAHSMENDALYLPLLNGKWFVDELHLQTTSLEDLLDVVLKENRIVNPCYASGLHTLSANGAVLGSISEILRTLQYHVLPNVLKGIICDDHSVLDMIAAVSNLQQNLLPLDKLVRDLNENLEATNQNRPVPHTKVQDTMVELKAKLATLTQNLHTDQQTATMGQQIFMQFTQMFERLENVQNRLIAAVDDNNKMLSKSKWKRVDQIKEAKTLSTTITNPAKRTQYFDIFLVRRLEAMIEFFTMCLQLACAFKGKGDLLSDGYFEHTIDPFKRLLADYAGQLLLGIGPQYFAVTICAILENVVSTRCHESVDAVIKEIGGDCKMGGVIPMFELCHQVYEGAVKCNDLSVHGITQSTYYCEVLKEAWWRKENVIYWENTIKMQTIEIQRVHQMLSAYFWINEGLIMQSQQMQVMNLCPISRESMLLQLRNAVQSLTGWQATIQKIRDELQNFSTAVIQRLKWAAGANPALIELQQAFEQMTHAKREKIDKECLLAAVALKYCTSTLNYELLRIDSVDSAKLDADFVNMAGRWDKACHIYKSSASIVNPVEEALVELLDPEGPVDTTWIKNVSDLLDDMTDHAQQEMSRFEKDITVSQDQLQMNAHKLRDLITKHHRLANDMKTLLKTTQKIEDHMAERVKVYLSKYKEFMDTITELNGNVLSQDFTESVVKQTLEQLTVVFERLDEIFDGLFMFEKSLKEQPVDKQLANIVEKETTSDPVLTPQRKRAQTQKEQKLNAYAVSVGRRIRMKLEGRDLDPNKRCTVQEQVDWVIREAMDIDNLASVYEGWTPWV